MTERAGFSPEEVAAKLGLNKKTVYQAIRDNQIPALRIGRRIIVTKPVLDRMLNEGRNQ